MSTRRGRTAARIAHCARFAAEFAEQPRWQSVPRSRSAQSSCWRCLRRWIRRRTPTTCAARHSRRAPAAGLSEGLAAATICSAPTARAATCCARSSTACAPASLSAPRVACLPSLIGTSLGLIGRFRRRPGRQPSHAHRRHPAQLPLDPGGADPARLARKGVDKIILALVIVQWAYYARTVRGAALVERNKEYIEAAHGLGLVARRASFCGICCPTACRR